MKVLIVGAGGPLGKALVEEALEQKHIVTALVQDSAQAAALRVGCAEEANLTITEADALRIGSLDAPLVAQDAVICSLSVKQTRQPVTALSEGTGNLLRAMMRHNVRRLLCITGIGAGSSRGHGGLVFDRLVSAVPLKTTLEDWDRQERLVEACDRDWVLIRPARLTDGKASARFSAILNMRGLTASCISYNDVAMWTVAQLESNKYLYRAVVLTE